MIGVVGGLVAGQFAAPAPLIFIVPGVLILVPGSAASILRQSTVSMRAGIDAGFDMFVTVMAIADGLMVAESSGAVDPKFSSRLNSFSKHRLAGVVLVAESGCDEHHIRRARGRRGRAIWPLVVFPGQRHRLARLRHHRLPGRKLHTSVSTRSSPSSASSRSSPAPTSSSRSRSLRPGWRSRTRSSASFFNDCRHLGARAPAQRVRHARGPDRLVPPFSSRGSSTRRLCSRSRRPRLESSGWSSS